MNGRAWTTGDLSRLRRLVASGMTDAQIGDDMGRDRDVVRRKRAELDLAPGRNPKHTAIMARINLRRRLARAGR